MTSTRLNRRQFLRIGPDHAAVLRPPRAISEAAFRDRCTRCGDCIDACPEAILLAEGANGYPRVDFGRSACSFCDDCVRACPTSALNPAAAAPWRIRAVIGPSCLAARQVVCVTCGEQCEAAAIRFPPRIGSVAPPEINIEACTGCGACVAPCPAAAIEVRHPDEP